MSNLISMGSCPHCLGGVKSPCFATYVDGWKCFSCGVSKSYNSHRMAIMGRKRLEIKRGVVIPQHTRNPQQFAPSVLKWLYKYYVFDDLIKKHRIGFIEGSNSLLCNVIKDNEIVFAQTRSFPDKRIIGIGEKQLYKIENGYKKVVIVEDYVSAIRLAELSVDAICLFGTSIHISEISVLLDKYNSISIWLDNDDAGIRGSKKLLKAFNEQINQNKSRFPLKYTQDWVITNINTNQDPKCYSTEELEGYLYDQSR